MSTLDLRLAVTDSPVGDYPEKIKCREHNDKVGSLAVYPDHIHCFGGGCGHHLMGIWALAYLLKVGVDEARGVEQKYTTEALDGYRERAAQEARLDPMAPALASIYHDVLRHVRNQRLDWLYARGLSDATIDRYRLGHDGMRFVIPIYDAEGQLISLRFRRDDHYDDQGSKYMGVKGRNGLYLYPERELAGTTTDYIWIVEGELDAIRLWQEGIPAVTVTNGAGQTPKLPQLLRERFPQITSLFIATDQDEPGQEAARLTEQAAIKAGFDPLLIHPVTWEGAKDVTEALQLGRLDLIEHLATAFGG